MKDILSQFTSRKAHPAIQFIKYGIAGGVATAVDMALFFLLAWLAFPALRQDEWLVRLFDLSLPILDEAVRSRNFVIDKTITFVFSNLTAYLLNIMWVFEPGRHSRHKEIVLFYLVSITSYVIGTALGWAMILYLHTSTTVAYLANMVASVMINYVCRKYFVFKG
ncbi:MAG: GtrA family protein [Kiritimatiellae bacterium]|nr:GtrA family protein [Kiritimatiellia bacterium]